MPEPIERKFIDLKALKMSDEGPGDISGYRSVFGVIDEGGDLVIPGAFKNTLDEYLHLGFTAQSHDWDFKEAVGYPVEAYEDEHGWFVKSQFHSTPDAQLIRTKAKERMDAGKQVGFSFGYAVKDKLFIEAKDYKVELPKYIKPDLLPAMMIKAQDFNRIRVLKSVEAIEDSIVTSPMNKRAAATAVKSRDGSDPLETKGLYEDVIADCETSLYFLTDKLISAIYRAQMIDDYSESTSTTFDFPGAIDLILAEFSARVRAAVVDADTEEDSTGMMANDSGFSFKGDLRERLPFAKHAETVRGAVEAFAQRGAVLVDLVTEIAGRRKAIDELRETKVGATYSSANLTDMQKIHDGIGKVRKDMAKIHAGMADVISRAKKPEKSDDQFDVAALRTQSTRLESDALSLLSN